MSMLSMVGHSEEFILTRSHTKMSKAFLIAKGKVKMSQLKFDNARSVYVDDARNVYVLTTDDGTSYTINSYEFTRKLEELMNRGMLDTISVIRDAPSFWEDLLKHDDRFADVFEKEHFSLSQLIENNHQFSQYEIISDDDTLAYDRVHDVSFFGVSFQKVDFVGTHFVRCNFEYCDFQDCTFDGDTHFHDCSLAGVDFSGIALSSKNFLNCLDVNLSGTIWPSRSDWLNANLEKNKLGYIAYKSFGFMFSPNPEWKIEENSVITESVDYDAKANCSYGINVCTADSVERHSDDESDIWKCLIHFEDLVDVVVPDDRTGKFRAGRVQLLGVISREELYQAYRNKEEE